MLNAMMALVLPIHVTGIRKPSMEMEGIVYRKLMIPSVREEAFRFSAMRIPILTPTMVAKTIAIADICKCS